VSLKGISANSSNVPVAKYCQVQKWNWITGTGCSSADASGCGSPQ